jgi:hypothetical protein
MHRCGQSYSASERSNGPVWWYMLQGFAIVVEDITIALHRRCAVVETGRTAGSWRRLDYLRVYMYFAWSLIDIHITEIPWDGRVVHYHEFECAR